MRPVTPSAIGSSLRDRSPIVGSSDKYSLRAASLRRWSNGCSTSRRAVSSMLGAGVGVSPSPARAAPRLNWSRSTLIRSRLSRRALHSRLLAYDGATVICGDYTQAVLPPHDGKTAFIGNPPYVRHHSLSARAKAWAQLAADRAGVPISGLAGLHAYFFLATALHGRTGDVGCFVTSSEWLDVNYGEVIRRLLLGDLGGRSIHVLEPELLPFDAIATTAAITCFEVGSCPSSIRLRMVGDAAKLSPLTGGRRIKRARLTAAPRWLPLIRSAPKIPDGCVELGELCRVHRGAVTGANSTWVVPPDEDGPIPTRYLFPSVTKARELFSAGNRLETTTSLRRVINLPSDLDALEPSELPAIERFLRGVKASGAADGYVARNRKAWWSVGLREPAPILATYMARRAPAFVRNVADARHINIAHGLYPLIPMPDAALDRLAVALRESANIGLGRTYAVDW